MSSFLSRARAGGNGQAPPSSLSGGEWSVLFPAVVEFLTAARWPEGDPRLPGSLTLFCDALSWKACLNDKDQGRVAFISGDTPEAVLVALEAGLVGDSLSWRAQRPGGSKRSKS